MIFRATLVVRAIEERFTAVWVEGFGENAVSKRVSSGWVITFDNMISLRVEERPEIAAGAVAIMEIRV